MITKVTNFIMNSFAITYTLNDAVNALEDEMKYNMGGWHLVNITKIKDAATAFTIDQTKSFLSEAVKYMRGPDATAIIKFKLAQLLNLLNSYKVVGFCEAVDEQKYQIYSAYEFMYDSTFKDATQAMIKQIVSVPNPVRLQPKIPTKSHRIKTSTPIAKAPHNFMEQSILFHNAMRQTTPPPQR